jgi:hypothetical protein
MRKHEAMAEIAFGRVSANGTVASRMSCRRAKPTQHARLTQNARPTQDPSSASAVASVASP